MEKIGISIIGAGPAGIATAIQLTRLGYEPNIFEKDRIGGLLWNANLVENYPGFPNGISGRKLAHLMEKQVINLGINVINSEIKQLEDKEDYYLIFYDGKSIQSDIVVIASGTKPKSISTKISGNALRNVHRDIRNLSNTSGKHIAIIGSGDAAFDHALFLSRKNRITILNRGKQIKSIQILFERAVKIKEITYRDDTNVYNIDMKTDRQERKSAFIIQCTNRKKDEILIECDEVLFAIGRDPYLDFCKNVKLNDRCILVGDVKNGIFRQASIATGDGILAAMKINEYINFRGNK
jgi:thioredoxin reductase (NADPH)